MCRFSWIKNRVRVLYIFFINNKTGFEFCIVFFVNNKPDSSFVKVLLCKNIV